MKFIALKIVQFMICWSFFASAQASNLFELDPLSLGQNKLDSSIKSTPPKSFSARLRSDVIKDDSILINLPHKRIQASRMPLSDSQRRLVSSYKFDQQNGFLSISKKVNGDDEIIIFDEQNNTVYKGKLVDNNKVKFELYDTHQFICVNYDTEPQATAHNSERINFYKNLDDLTLETVTNLQSRPQASNIIYIDYLAGSITDTSWNNEANDPIVYNNYSYDSNPYSFSLIDLQSMYAAWAEMAEDYAPFNVNITTNRDIYNATPHRNKSRIIATSTRWRSGGGVAYINVFGQYDHDFYSIGWTFNRNFGSMGMTHSHEAGHQMGLLHDGSGVATVYYQGHGNYGPIMGAPFNQDFVHWNNGDYDGANQTQDDLNLIGNRLGVVSDDHGDSREQATELDFTEVIGLISPAGLNGLDTDYFKISLQEKQRLSIQVRSLFNQPNFNYDGAHDTAGGLNLSAKIELRDEDNHLIFQKLPSSDASANDFNFKGLLWEGTYYLSISPTPYTPIEFSNYGNGGYYQITKSVLPIFPLGSVLNLLLEDS